MVDQKRIQSLLDSNFSYSGNVTIDDQGQITVDGDVIVKRMTEIPLEIKLLEVTGNFGLYSNPIIQSLEGAPQRVGGDFYCTDNLKLQSLRGAPERVGGNFDCRVNQELRSLDGAPQIVDGDFYCYSNPQLQSIAGLPSEIGGQLYITYSQTLPLLRMLVAKGGVEFVNDSVQQTGRAITVAKIINRYKGQGRAGAFDCRRELRASGFEDNARW